MSARSPLLRLRLLAATLAFGAPLAADAGARPTASLRVLLVGGGGEQLREQAEESIRTWWRASGCLDLVSGAGEEPPGLGLEIDLGAVEESTEYDRSIADRTQSSEPDALRASARYRVAVRWRLVLAGSGALVRQGRFAIDEALRPVNPSEDAAEGARIAGLERLARQSARDVCRGSAERLLGQIEAARRRASSADPPR